MWNILCVWQIKSFIQDQVLFLTQFHLKNDC